MKRHSLDVLSLVFGLIFLGIAGSWIIRTNWDLNLPDAGLYIAAALIVAGLFGIVSTLRGGRSDSRSAPPADHQPVEYPPSTPPTGWASPAGTTAEYGVTTEDKPEDRGF